jgi:hypothetical protein
MATEPQINNSYAITGMASTVPAVFGLYQQLESKKAEAEAYKFNAQRSRMAGQAALTQSKLNNAVLQERFNETQALQNVAFAVQGRSGATIANIISQDQENLNWDKKFMELSGVISKAGYDIDAAGQEIAASQAIKSGYQQAAVGMLEAASSMAKVV